MELMQKPLQAAEDASASESHAMADTNPALDRRPSMLTLVQSPPEHALFVALPGTSDRLVRADHGSGVLALRHDAAGDVQPVLPRISGQQGVLRGGGLRRRAGLPGNASVFR